MKPVVHTYNNVPYPRRMEILTKLAAAHCKSIDNGACPLQLEQVDHPREVSAKPRVTQGVDLWF